jgi:hypothetical protein
MPATALVIKGLEICSSDSVKAINKIHEYSISTRKARNTPPTEPPLKIWPVKTPEVIPGKDPEEPTAPNEIPAPPKSRRQVSVSQPSLNTTAHGNS